MLHMPYRTCYTPFLYYQIFSVSWVFGTVSTAGMWLNSLFGNMNNEFNYMIEKVFVRCCQYLCLLDNVSRLTVQYTVIQLKV